MAKKPKPIPANIGEYLKYRENIGDLIWIKKSASKVELGNIAGTISRKGYIVIVFNGSKYLAHRIIWFIKTGNQPTNEIDHRNGNKADNTWTNLREATGNENQQNKGKQKNNTSGYRGVSWHKNTGKWKAQIKVNNRVKHIGLFPTPEAAHEAYCITANKYHKEYANYG